MTKDLDINQLQHADRFFQKKKKKEASDEFVAEHMSMVEAIVSTLSGGGKVPSGMERNDLIAWGLEGLLKAHQNFDDTKGTQFKTYAFYRIRGEVLDRIRNEWKYRNPHEHREYKKKKQEKMADYVEDALQNEEESGTGDPTEALEAMVSNTAMLSMLSLEFIEVSSEAEGTRDPQIEIIDNNQSELWDEVKNLSEEEREIVDLFYVKGLKQKDIALRMKCSRSTICRLHTKALETLKQRILEKGSA